MPEKATPAASATDLSQQAVAPASYRWTICALLFFATTINYIDRAVLGILGPTLKEQFSWSELQFSRINLAFQTAYAIGLLLSGRFMDRFGTRKGLAWAITFWSLAAIGHAAARSFLGFSVARFALGLGEAGNFPGCIKAVAEWYPKKERALVTGIFNSGSNVGAVVAPLTVPWIALNWGWQWAFILTGVVGFAWLACWLLIYQPPESHPRLSPGELAYIRSDPAEPATHIPWARLLQHRQTWAFALGKFMTDPVWWFFLFWLPSFFKANFGVGLTQISLPLIIVYLAADVGSIGGGWLSSSLIRRKWSVNASRKTAMLVSALCVLPVFFAAMTTNKWVAIGLIGLALAAHQGWSANLFTLASDMFPRRAVGSVVGIGGMAGAVGGMAIAEITGRVLTQTANYTPLFIIASCTYAITLLLVHLMTPRLEPAAIE